MNTYTVYTHTHKHIHDTSIGRIFWEEGVSVRVGGRKIREYEDECV